MKRIKWILFMVWLFIATAEMMAQERDTLPLLSRSLEHATADVAMLRYYHDNVALHHLLYPSSLSTFGTEYHWRHEDRAFLQQNGSGESLTHIYANTYLKPSESQHLWGNATYSSGLIKGVRFNSTSDFARLYPYTVADAEGGNLLHERYAFGGGYSRAYHQWRMAGEVQYLSQQEYRRVDPRPRNIVSNLTMNMGVAHPLGSYIVGVSLGHEIYKQRSSVAFYSPLGTTIQWLMNGLGGSFARFNTNTPTVYYRGYGLASTAHLVPSGVEGFSAKIGYQYHRLEETLTDMNEVPIHHYNDHQVEVALGYLWQGTCQQGVELKAEIQNRKGVEHIVGEPTAGTYPVIGELPNFYFPHYKGTLAWHVGRSEGGMNWHLSPTLSYRYLAIRKLEPKSLLQSQRWQVALSGFGSYQIDKASYIALSCNIGYSPLGKGELSLSHTTLKEELSGEVRHSFATINAAQLFFEVASKWHYTIQGWGALPWGVEVGGRYRFDQYSGGGVDAIHRHRVEGVIQILF
ncbi:DUF6850 family outer membrane beta-barrel protein [Porphyromonas somerae]|uniref:DUF6850 family outer membrane beta-barrel protein n=1 Tax=Porphyromonas somerae TaxID=322095 RepID=UPI002A81F1DA|nr:DUF6850 family outer membrane beta-barrel protein [Porphyromonas somerae]MDY3885359.1 hypothetical protein [Porphyromonas somerae]